ncbi:hypothetical protein ASPZODRAFT_154897 [Penicilliopsis zonata CBS 506.65]|uniref:Ubiquitin-like protease family profile domain-containing protein n=1 Tax=Penicilliopsis zonata CBS 506.65 TaxID=1073090 RepID=A0A1L9S6X8_9EURO|nr:hypothetical protein ASPZODRAFT_154897 [Penicilliopsis zonata CBS 506.65]OJJ42917.1 hypothetical protein ASPZODRAFT_154897 [Penicilliopsis zonata CBS 506.65]
MLDGGLGKLHKRMRGRFGETLHPDDAYLSLTREDMQTLKNDWLTDNAEGGTHWSLLLISIVDGIAFHYDSLPPGNHWEAYNATVKVGRLLNRAIRFVHLSDSPVQENGSDCGVFVCLTMRYLLLKRLLQTNSDRKVSMSLGHKEINATAGRKEIAKIIDGFRKEGERRRSQLQIYIYNMNSLPAAYYRGGTSRALLFHEHHLPRDRTAWTRIFLGVMGSPDARYSRQLDGLGGGISSLSKICVVRPSRRADAHVDFTFVQVGVHSAEVDYAGNCGNMTSAIGPFAVNERLIRLSSEIETETTVSLYNTNTDKLIHSTFPVYRGEAVATGDFAIDGVAGTGARVRLDFLDPAGSRTGCLLPTGKIVDCLDVGGDGREGREVVRVTCIDVGNPSVFVSADELGIEGSMLPDETQRTPGLLDRLERIRRCAAVAMGLAEGVETVAPSIPKICFISKSAPSSSSSVVVRAISTGQPHKALPITVGLAVSAAARLEGSIVHECVRKEDTQDTDIVIGHPSGQLVVGAAYEGGKLQRATVYRTARRLMEGRVFIA